MRKTIDFSDEEIKEVERFKEDRPHIKSFSEAVRQMVRITININATPKSAGEV